MSKMLRFFRAKYLTDFEGASCVREAPTIIGARWIRIVPVN